MAKRLQEYVKYTTMELDQYSETKGSCVRKINTNLHLSLGPFCLADFKHVLMNHLVRSKVGFYDVQLDGIVLDVKKIKVLGTTGALRADDARIHVNINGDVYVFKPEEGAQLTGIVKHIGLNQVGVILYRVFNANLRVSHKVDKNEIKMDQEVKFRICKYNLQNIFPYIDGELLTPGAQIELGKAQRTVFKQEDNVDSGIEKDGSHELDQILSVIKTEAPSEYEEALEESFKKKSKKSKKSKASKEDSAIAESPDQSATKKSSKERKSFTTLSASVNAEESIDLTPYSPNKIKCDLNFSDDDEQALEESSKKKSKKSKKSKATKEDFIAESPDQSATKKSSKERESFTTLSASVNAEESIDLTPYSPKKIKCKLNFSDDDNFPTTHKKLKKEKDLSLTKKHRSKKEIKGDDDYY